MRDGETGPRGTLADRLDRLFRIVRSPEGRPYTIAEAARAIAAAGGPTISPTYLWELRTGRATDPRRSHLQALASFFGVAPGYFFDDERDGWPEGDPAILLALRDVAVRRLVVRLAGLSPTTLLALATIVDQARRLERLTDVEDGVVEAAGLVGAAGRPSRDGHGADGRADGQQVVDHETPGASRAGPSAMPTDGALGAPRRAK